MTSHAPATALVAPGPADPSALAGEWRLERRVVDLRSRQFGRLEGTLVVCEEGEGVSWHERGTLRWAARELPATRLLRLRPLDGAWWMTFADGRLFHPWEPRARLVHHCRDDRYSGWFDVDPAGTVIRTLWDVQGRTKRQRIFTRYQRVLPPGTGCLPPLGSDRGARLAASGPARCGAAHVVATRAS